MQSCIVCVFCGLSGVDTVYGVFFILWFYYVTLAKLCAHACGHLIKRRDGTQTCQSHLHPSILLKYCLEGRRLNIKRQDAYASYIKGCICLFNYEFSMIIVYVLLPAQLSATLKLKYCLRAPQMCFGSCTQKLFSIQGWACYSHIAT